MNHKMHYICIKKKFGKNTNFDFYIGKKNLEQKLYDQFVMMSGNEETKNEDFFHFIECRKKYG